MKARSKQFLNDSHMEFGSVSWYVETSGDEFVYSSVIDAELRIRDCSKTITLEFSCEEIKHIDKRLQKLDTLIESLQELRGNLVEAGELIKKKELSKSKFYY